MPRDISVPLTNEELEEAKAIFQSMPTYNEEGYFLPQDLKLFCDTVGYERTPEQIAAYIEYWDKNFGGKIQLAETMETLNVLHNTPMAICHQAAALDKDGDGFISADEFVELVELMVIHDPRLKGVSFAKFVEEADTNLDGKVSIDECGIWVQNRFQQLGYAK